MVRIKRVAVILIATCTVALFAGSAPAEGERTKPGTVKGSRWAKTSKPTLTVHNTTLAAATLKAQLGTKATCVKKGSVIEVRGATAGEVATALKRLAAGKNGKVTKKGRTPRAHKAFTAVQLEALRKVNQAVVHYGFVNNWGRGSLGTGPGSKFPKRSPYPIPVCWKLDCPDCGPMPATPTNDCGDLKKKKDDLLDKLSQIEAKQALMQAVLEAYKKGALAKGIADMVGDMVTAATTILTAGGGTAAASAGGRILGQMALDGMVGSILEEVIGADGLAGMSEAALEAAISKINKERKAAHAAYMAAALAWRNCMEDAAKATKKYKMDLSNWESCRWRVARGFGCTMTKIPCP